MKLILKLKSLDKNIKEKFILNIKKKKLNINILKCLISKEN